MAADEVRRFGQVFGGPAHHLGLRAAHVGDDGPRHEEPAEVFEDAAGRHHRRRDDDEPGAFDGLFERADFAVEGPEFLCGAGRGAVAVDADEFVVAVRAGGEPEADRCPDETGADDGDAIVCHGTHPGTRA